MLLKDTGIVLRLYPHGNTSRIAVWLTRRHGKLATLLKGAHRPRSPLLGQTDLFYTSELLFYARENRRLHVLKETTPLDPRPAFRADWRACAAASYLAALADRTLPFGPIPPDHYPLLDFALARLASRPATPPFLLWFEIRWLRLLGLLPDPSDAPSTGPLTPDARQTLARLASAPTLPAALPASVFRQLDALLARLLPAALEDAPLWRGRSLARSILALP